jgi:aminoglycoside/choline kinase family phosphotransferase
MRTIIPPAPKVRNKCTPYPTRQLPAHLRRHPKRPAPVEQTLTLAIPASPDAISPNWLTAALRQSQSITTARVTAADLSRIGEDEGFTGGSLYRIKLNYDRLENGAPTTLVAKLSPTNPEMRTIMRAANQREAVFYQSLASPQTLPVPHCYHADFDPDSGASILLLQDLSGFRSVSFANGCGPADTKRVVEALAKIHGRWWNSPKLAALSGAAIVQEFPFSKLWGDYPAKVTSLLPNVDLPDSFLKLGDHIAGNQTAIFTNLMETAPITCLHRDIQIDNVMFDTDSSSAAILLDWQLSGKGRGTYDVAYFLISSLDPALRRNTERSLVALYHVNLLHAGVTDYSLSQCWSDYLQSVAGKLFITVGATVLLDNASPHKKAWRATDLARLLAFCDDHVISERTFR